MFLCQAFGSAGHSWGLCGTWEAEVNREASNCIFGLSSVSVKHERPQPGKLECRPPTHSWWLLKVEDVGRERRAPWHCLCLWLSILVPTSRCSLWGLSSL